MRKIRSFSWFQIQSFLQAAFPGLLAAMPATCAWKSCSSYFFVVVVAFVPSVNDKGLFWVLGLQ